ncbi:MAG TPA: hypothetical protein DEA89_04330 [Candidatus Moranbacteria bacterium]|nr:hypothetical protein [Candidatus Moranbacteria bacterium]
MKYVGKKQVMSVKKSTQQCRPGLDPGSRFAHKSGLVLDSRFHGNDNKKEFLRKKKCGKKSLMLSNKNILKA